MSLFQIQVVSSAFEPKGQCTGDHRERPVNQRCVNQHGGHPHGSDIPVPAWGSFCHRHALGQTLRWSKSAEFASVQRAHESHCCGPDPFRTTSCAITAFVCRCHTLICTFACPVHSQPDKSGMFVLKPSQEPWMSHLSRAGTQEPVLPPTVAQPPQIPCNSSRTAVCVI